MDIDAQRKVSHALFGNSYVLEVGAAIGRSPKERFTQKDIAGETGLDKGLVQIVFGRLRRALLLEVLPKEGTFVPCQRVESAIWEAFDLLKLELERD